ncbi:MAG: hypothetical protein IJO74_01410 [Clostridia bacterium]|nr:hypothetical protein [Clostridia bacterium]
MMKNYPYTAIGVSLGIASLVGGIVADLLVGNKKCSGIINSCNMRHKAGQAMHTIGNCIERAGDTLQGN